MSVDVRDLSGANVIRLTRLLSRRPEYGIAIPSRRWLIRQEEKLKSLPSELLRTSNPLKRLVIRIADSIDPTVIDPRAILCKTHATLNPWLIRRLFLAVAYEVTVHTDTLRSWKGRRDFPIISAFIGRVDAIAALWTEPELYRECYGTPPFENHMVFVRSGCEACILSAIGANARVLADLRSILVDRIERRVPRPDRRPAKEPRLARFVDEWINHLKEERAAKCIAISEDVLAELRATRSQVSKWRSRRKKQSSGSKGSRQPVYNELRTTESGHQLSSVPGSSRRKRRTRNGIPVAMVDAEGAEEQRRMAMFSMTREAEGAKSIFRPDSMCDYSQFGPPRMAAYDPANSIQGLQQELPSANGNDDLYDDFEEMEDQADLDRNPEAEEKSRSKVTDWYAMRVAESRADLSMDDTRSVLSMVHPAFQPAQAYSQLSAAPPPLRLNKDHQPNTEHLDSNTVWTDATVYTFNPDHGVPPVPRVPSAYKGEGIKRTSSVRSPRSRSSAAARPPRPASQQCHRLTTASSSVYSELPPPSAVPPFDSRLRNSTRNPTPAPARQPTRKFLFDDASEGGSHVSAGQRQYLQTRKGIKDFAREDNPFTRENTPRLSAGSSSTPRESRVPSMSSSRGDTVTDAENDVDDDFGPPTPLDGMWRQGWSFPEGDEGDDASLRPEDSLTAVGERAYEERVEYITPWGQFARKGQR
ncbi:hypothetical protein F4781DRAFT_113374 [Annulohypoxylon bovei var. microspora]|nr:hypothetical protein F4781DRAFT_113374 [Annulohypoxylon bovei var. microspora]